MKNLKLRIALIWSSKNGHSVKLLLLIKNSFKISRIFISQIRMKTITVIKHFDVLDNITSCIAPGTINCIGRPFFFKLWKNSPQQHYPSNRPFDSCCRYSRASGNHRRQIILQKISIWLIFAISSELRSHKHRSENNWSETTL